MPKELEAKLRREAAEKGYTGDRADRYVFGAMNNLGLMHGSKVTAKGARMERTTTDAAVALARRKKRKD